jgi:hypothetical protein
LTVTNFAKLSKALYRYHEIKVYKYRLVAAFIPWSERNRSDREDTAYGSNLIRTPNFPFASQRNFAIDSDVREKEEMRCWKIIR